MTSDFDSIPDAPTSNAGYIQLPLIVAPDAVIFPRIVAPLAIIEGESMEAVRAAFNENQTVLVVAAKGDNPFSAERYDIGTEVALGQMLPFPGQLTEYSVLCQGRRRVRIVEVTSNTDTPYPVAKAVLIPEDNTVTDETQIVLDMVQNLFESVTELSDSTPDDVLEYAMSIESPSVLADFITSTLSANVEERQAILELADATQRLRKVAALLKRELDMLQLRDEISGQIQQEMNRTQREMYLREQMRVIQTELGEEDIFQQELNDVQQQIMKAVLTVEARERAVKEMNRLAMMPPMAPEVGIIRSYIDWITAIPWVVMSDDNLDIAHAKRVLDADHYGLEKVKDRILETIAVRKLAREKMKSPILCFVGPPGVGKTSIGKSIAKALGREFVRVSLGGVRDEAEIRGHRRTYIGALPGRIIQTMRRAGTVNPVFMLDEIDKIGADFRGDPAAALLEALDPEQNNEYSDHYLELPYDLSKVMFITTANDLYPLPAALLDRMEVVEFPGYTEEEKLEIAKQFLIPNQLEANGIQEQGLKFENSAIQTLIRQYTYEAGVRNLNREVGTVARKLARKVAEDKKIPRRITSNQVNTLLGPPYYLDTRVNREDSVGLATGLAWTMGGGDTLTIEVSVLPGKGSLMLTGQLGDVMQESAQAAMSYMRSRAKDFDVPFDDFENYDLHVHLPEGAVPKDGPSAGITLAAAIISAFTERPVRSDVAMTGEITLRGRVLPVGGIKEKVLAARRAMIKNIIIPADNKKDLEEVAPYALRDLTITTVDDMQQVIDMVLLDPPTEGRQRDKDREEEDKANGESESDDS